MLVGLTLTPKVFAAGIDLVGVSDWAGVIENVPPYWKHWTHRFYEYQGDPKDPADRKEMAARSPANFLDRVERPLLVIQGANDVRVIKEQSDRVVEELRKAGKPVEYLLFDNEGHSIEKWENRVLVAQRIEHFLAGHLGGRAGAVEFFDVAEFE